MAKLAQCQECDKLHITLSEKNFQNFFQKCLFWPKKSKNMKKNSVSEWVRTGQCPPSIFMKQLPMKCVESDIIRLLRWNSLSNGKVSHIEFQVSQVVRLSETSMRRMPNVCKHWTSSVCAFAGLAMKAQIRGTIFAEISYLRPSLGFRRKFVQRIWDTYCITVPNMEL